MMSNVQETIVLADTYISEAVIASAAIQEMAKKKRREIDNLLSRVNYLAEKTKEHKKKNEPV